MAPAPEVDESVGVELFADMRYNRPLVKQVRREVKGYGEVLFYWQSEVVRKQPIARAERNTAELES